MRCLVTGIGGFAGRHLARRLAGAGHIVIGLDRGGSSAAGASSSIAADLLDASATIDAVASAQPEGIFPLAAPQTSVGRSWTEPASTVAGNVTTAVNLLEAGRRLASP